MHSVRFVNNWLMRKCSFMHRARARSLGRAVGALLSGGKLSLTHLGRSLSGASYEKHRIKSMDRLLGNGHLHNERLEVYRRLAGELLSCSQRPVVAPPPCQQQPVPGCRLAMCGWRSRSPNTPVLPDDPSRQRPTDRLQIAAPVPAIRRPDSTP